MNEKLEKIIENFDVCGKLCDVKPITTGHINTTYRISIDDGTKKTPYTLQIINKYVFHNPMLVMDNILKVTTHLKKKIAAEGGNPERECLSVIKTREGVPCYRDEEENYWRLYSFVDNAYTVDVVETPEQLKSAGEGFGRFQQMLSDFPMDELAETIPRFHDSAMRLEQLEQAVQEDVCSRASDVKNDVEFFLERREEMCSLVKMQQAGVLPLRVTHNDTKFNNILIDKMTNKALCVIDLDTVMPGLSVLDFGDAIRFAANSAEEDERDLSRIHLDMTLYEAFTEGFVSKLSGFLTNDEIELMPLGAKVITMELASRFLADHINGDKYFKIHRENQNLDRARCQIKLARSMEENFDKMQEIVNRFCD